MAAHLRVVPLPQDHHDELQEPTRRVSLGDLLPLVALAHRNNYVVAKAADLVSKFRLSELIPELVAAFDRFFADPIKSDPQCWAKNALSRALAAFEHQDEGVFLRGMRHIQMEPSKYLNRFYYDSIIHSGISSEFLIKVAGPQRVMFGTDFPFDMGAASRQIIQTRTYTQNVGAIRDALRAATQPRQG